MENLIYGTLLGDAHISLDKVTPFLGISHSEAQLEYVQWKAKMLCFNGKIIRRTSGYGSVMHQFHYYNAALLKPIYNVCVKNGTKTVSDKWIEKLDSLSLAVWFQDDGSWGISGKRTKDGRRGQRYSNFHTQGFDLKSIELLVEWLKSKGYEARIKTHKHRYNFIVLNHTSTIKLWHEIAPYTILKYKIDNDCSNVNLCECGKTKLYSHLECDECLYKLAITSGGTPKKYFDNLAPRLIRRFGTSSIQNLKESCVVFKHPSVHRMDPAIIGSSANVKNQSSSCT